MTFHDEILYIHCVVLSRFSDPYKIIAGLESYQKELLAQYNRLVKMGELIPIEGIDKGDKDWLKSLDKQYFTGNIEDRINYCRCCWLVRNVVSG